GVSSQTATSSRERPVQEQPAVQPVVQPALDGNVPTLRRDLREVTRRLVQRWRQQAAEALHGALGLARVGKRAGLPVALQERANHLQVEAAKRPRALGGIRCLPPAENLARAARVGPDPLALRAL